LQKNIEQNGFKKNILKLILVLNKNKTYYSSFITRFYILYKDKSKVPIYKKIKKNMESKRYCNN